MRPLVPSILRRISISILSVLLAAAVALVVLILLFQNSLIYHPRKYSSGASGRYPSLVPLPYATAQGRQQAYYLPPDQAAAQAPHRLWVLFCGNASRALDWMDILESRPDGRDGFLLIDYPGYGDCEGSPSPGAIRDSAEAAFACLAETLKCEPKVLEENLNLLCLSIGCGAGLNFAVRHPVNSIILLAPFTSLRDMARRSVGWPLCWLLIHNFDNRARLRELAERKHPPQVTIFHGDDDTLVPITMGRELAGMFPAMITFQPVTGAKHNTILYDAQSRIFAAMRD